MTHLENRNRFKKPIVSMTSLLDLLFVLIFAYMLQVRSDTDTKIEEIRVADAEKLQVLEEEVASLLASLNSERAEANEVDRLEQQESELRTALERSEAEEDRLRSDLDAAHEAIEDLQLEVSDARSELAAMEDHDQEPQAMALAMSELEGEIESLQQQLEDARALAEDVSQRADNAERIIESLRTQLSSRALAVVEAEDRKLEAEQTAAQLRAELERVLARAGGGEGGDVRILDSWAYEQTNVPGMRDQGWVLGGLYVRIQHPDNRTAILHLNNPELKLSGGTKRPQRTETSWDDDSIAMVAEFSGGTEMSIDLRRVNPDRYEGDWKSNRGKSGQVRMIRRDLWQEPWTRRIQAP